MYINTRSLAFPSHPDEPDKTTITVTTADETFSVVADRLQGGQRLLVPPDATNMILGMLQNRQPLTLSAGKYHSEL